MRQFMQEQTERQDKVDGAIHDMLASTLDTLVSPQSIVWDAEICGDIRDLIFAYTEKRDFGIDEHDFYPSIHE